MTENRAPARTRKLTKTKVDALVPEAQRYKVWDEDLKGFGVAVEPSGHKSYVVRFRPDNGGRKVAMKQAAIGACGVLTAHEARAAAKKMLAEVTKGGDPLADRQARRQAANVNELLAFYLKDYAEAAGLRPGTIAHAKSLFSRFAAPLIGTMKVKDVTAADVRRVKAEAFKQSGRYQSNRTLAVLSSAFSRAVENGWRAANPVLGIERYPEEKRECYLNEAQLARLFAALDEYSDQSAANAIRLLLYFGARRNEVLHAPWSQFDLDNAVWMKPSAHTKQKKQHRLELGGPGLDLLREMRKRDPFGVWLFPGADPSKPRRDLKRPWDQIRKRAGLDITLHGLRHNAATYMIAGGASLRQVGSVLGHTQPATTARYAHLLENAQRTAMENAGRKIELLGKVKPAELVALPDRSRS